METGSPERLDRLMNARRLELDLDWKDVAALAEIAVQTLDAVRRGKNQPTERTKRRIERALRWRQGSIDAILAGRAPAPLHGDRPERTASPQDRELQLLREIRERVEQLERLRGQRGPADSPDHDEKAG